MIVTLIRRILILSSLIGILILTVLWLMTEEQKGSDQPNTVVKGDLKVYPPSGEEIDDILKILKEMGYNPQKIKEKGTKDLLQGYTVADTYSANVVDSIKQLLQSEHYKITVSTSDPATGKCRVQVEGTFMRKAQAESLVRQIAYKPGVVLKVEPVYKQVPAELNLILIEAIIEEQAGQLKEKLRNKAKDIKFIPYPKQN